MSSGARVLGRATVSRVLSVSSSCVLPTATTSQPQRYPEKLFKYDNTTYDPLPAIRAMIPEVTAVVALSKGFV